MSADIKRVRVQRTLTYQGPVKWVDGVVARMLTGTVHIGRDQYVISENGEPIEESAEVEIEPDHHVSDHWHKKPSEFSLAIHKQNEEEISKGVE